MEVSQITLHDKPGLHRWIWKGEANRELAQTSRCPYLAWVPFSFTQTWEKSIECAAWDGNTRRRNLSIGKWIRDVYLLQRKISGTLQHVENFCKSKWRLRHDRFHSTTVTYCCICSFLSALALAFFLSVMSLMVSLKLYSKSAPV